MTRAVTPFRVAIYKTLEIVMDSVQRGIWADAMPTYINMGHLYQGPVIIFLYHLLGDRGFHISPSVEFLYRLLSTAVWTCFQILFWILCLHLHPCYRCGIKKTPRVATSTETKCLIILSPTISKKGGVKWSTRVDATSTLPLYLLRHANVIRLILFLSMGKDKIIRCTIKLYFLGISI